MAMHKLAMRLHSAGVSEAAPPNSHPGLAAAEIVAEVKAVIGGANPTIQVVVNLTGIFRAPNLIFVSRWQCCAGGANDDAGGGCDLLHFVLMLFIVEINVKSILIGQF